MANLLAESLKVVHDIIHWWSWKVAVYWRTLRIGLIFGLEALRWVTFRHQLWDLHWESFPSADRFYKLGVVQRVRRLHDVPVQYPLLGATALLCRACCLPSMGHSGNLSPQGVTTYYKCATIFCVCQELRVDHSVLHLRFLYADAKIPESYCWPFGSSRCL